jgi:hypothetical protein
VVVVVVVAYYTQLVFQCLQEHRTQFQLAQAEHLPQVVPKKEPTVAIQHSVL